MFYLIRNGSILQDIIEMRQQQQQQNCNNGTSSIDGATATATAGAGATIKRDWKRLHYNRGQLSNDNNNSPLAVHYYKLVARTNTQ